MKSLISFLLLSFGVILSWCTSNWWIDQANTSPIEKPAPIIEEQQDEVKNEADEIDTKIGSLSSYFEDGTLIEDITITDCKPSDGTATSCYKIIVTHWIDADDIWPWCPRNIADSAEKWWIWLEDWKVHNVDWAFISQLAEFYWDDFWQLYDTETWEINVTDSKEACEWAARPNVDEQYFNHCVECLLSYLQEIPIDIYYIPVNPIKSDTTKSSSPFWFAFNGIRFDAPAPVDAILSAHTIAAFDDCGGHVNPVAGYHYHAETGCAPRIEQTDSHEALIWYALDWFQIYEHNEDIRDLDECWWHTDELRWYHYHISHPWLNQNLGCLSWPIGCVLSEDWACDASENTGRRWPPPGR